MQKERNYIIIEDGKVENVIVINEDQLDQFPGAIYTSDFPIMQGMVILDGHFVHEERKIAILIPPEGLSNKQIREYYYQHLRLKRDTTPLLEWEDENLTVDEAAIKYTAYFAEGSDKAEILQKLIVAAKEYVRQLCPDEMAQ